MLNKIKVTITREDGTPVCEQAGEDVKFLTDSAPVLVLRKDGGTVEAFSGDLHSLSELLRELLQN